ncbi:MAG: dCTP deaminase [Thermoprotei archaeon]|nr:MAG: dCTP deaminase [Thermoprotei archaeon]RLF03526.1 MAG: dCTP deaminase [Thermoprotei archaeon]
MILSRYDILKLIETGELVIEPLNEEIIRENGIDLSIGNEVAFLLNNPSPLDPEEISDVDLSKYYFVQRLDGDFIIQPYMKVLLSTLEYIKMPNDILGFVELRSTFARLGLSIPPTIIDAGFEGQITLEVHGGAFPVKLRKGLRFAHIVFAKLTSKTTPYRGKYQGQRGVTLPK